MIIKKLTIHNIASIEDAVIDFTQAPLSDSDVFLISGDTGSGKSTILDAICLALYATTPRMKNTKMEGAVSDIDDKTLQVNDPRCLLREGAGRGYVQLEFDGTNGIPYRADWIVHRARDKATGRLSPREWTLENLRTGKTLTTRNEIEHEITQATGLASFDQFCRTAMLAQGEFTRFLNSNDAEKAAILEKITGADIYAKIGKKVFELSKKKSEEYDKANRCVADNKPLPKEDREAKEAEMQDLERQSKAESDAKAKCETKRQFLRDEKKVKEDLEAAEKNLREAEETVGTEEFKAKSSLVGQYDETTEVRTHLATFERKKKEAGDAKKEICRLAGTYATIRSGLAYMELEKSQLKGELDHIQCALEDEKPDLPVIEKAQTVKGHLNTMIDGRKSIAGWTDKVNGIGTTLNEILTPALDRAKKDWNDAREAYLAAESDLKKAEKDVESADLRQVRDKLQSKKSLAADIRFAEVQLGALMDAIDARNVEKQGIDDDKKALSELNKQMGELDRELKVKSEAFESAAKTYDKVKQAEDTLVGDIRESLSVGDVCPVCRQKIVSVLPTSDEVSAIVRPVREAYETSKKQKEETEKEYRTLGSRIEAADNALLRRKHQYETVNPVPEKESAALEALKKCGFYENSATVSDDLRTLSENTDKEIEALSQADSEGKMLEDKAEKARRKEKECRDVVTAAKTELDVAEQKIRDAEAERGRIESLSENARKRVSEAEAELKRILAGSRWEKSWIQGLDAFCSDLDQAVQNHESNVRKEQELDKRLLEMEADVKVVEGQLKVVEEKEPSWLEISLHAPDAVSDLKKKSENLKDDVLVKESTLSMAQKEADDAERIVEMFFLKHSGYSKDILNTLSGYSKAEMDRKAKEVEEAEKAVGRFEAVKNSIEQRKASLLSSKPEIGEGDTEDSLTTAIMASDTTIKDLAGRIALLKKELDDDQKKYNAQKVLQDNADKLKLEADRWARLSDLFGSADGNAFRKIAQSYVLGSLVNAANEYMAKLTDRYTLKVHPGTFIIELEDAYQGFASRVASTISGGESFLVSLSLALALSDIGSGLSVDTIFIDEGFGTLSGEPLQRAVDTLKSLNKQLGRHVGIISHIKDLREKIPVKIVVEQKGNSSASTVKSIIT